MRVSLTLAPPGRVRGARPCPELRGWSLGSLDVGVAVRPSELAAPCPVRRDVWLLRHGFKLSGPAVGKGREYHEEVLGVFRAALRGWGGLRKAVTEGVVRSHAGAWAVAVASAWLSGGCVPPIAVEPLLPPVAGFTRSRPDLVVGVAPVEVAYSPAGLNGRYAWRKRVEVAVYALIIEALTHSPVDYGWLVMVDDSSVHVEGVAIDDSLREEALSAREEVADVVASPAPPDLPSGGCPEACPFIKTCLGEVSGDG